MQIDANKLATLNVMNQQVPGKGVTIPVLLDMTQNNGVYTLDLSAMEQQSRIDFIQTIFIDMSQSGVPLSVMDLTTNHEIVANAHTQGFYNLLASNPTKLLIQCPGGPAALKMYFTNLPIPGAVWAATHP